MPVPLQRNMPNRRNEYVNMPVNSHPMPPAHAHSAHAHSAHDQNSLSSASPDLSAPPLPPHNYANMPINKNPQPPPRSDEPRSLDAPRRPYNFNRQPRYTAIESDQEPLSYNDTQTLRADQKLDYPPPRSDEPRSLEAPRMSKTENGFSDSTDTSSKPQFRQLHLDYGGSNRAEPQQATRIPSGHARRENRASLRAKHRRDMEEAQGVKVIMSHYWVKGQ